MKKSSSLLALALLSSLAFTSCEKRPNLNGSWQGSPTRIDNITAAAYANATYTLSFAPIVAKNETGGSVNISAVIEATQPVSGQFNNGFDAAYETSVTATASIDGRWMFEPDEDDDIILSLDPNTIQVSVDPNGVTFSQNLLTQAQQPVVDSLTTATAQAWQKSIKAAIGEEFFKFSKISDIEIHNDIMSCEINDRDQIFRAVE